MLDPFERYIADVENSTAGVNVYMRKKENIFSTSQSDVVHTPLAELDFIV